MVSHNIFLEIIGSKRLDDVVSGLSSLFARRYIPSTFIVYEKPVNAYLGARIEWRPREDSAFIVEDYRLSSDDVDHYVVSSDPPKPYVNESPIFFILQVLARAHAKNDKLFLTDTVSFARDEGAILVLGYPHCGKSTLTALALHNGYTPLSTENTIVELRGEKAYIVEGTSVLVYDPIITKLYKVNVPYHEETRHGYRIVDLDRLSRNRRRLMSKGVPIDKIYLVYSSFSSVGANYKAVKGRKIIKTLWYFSTALVSGLDYYDPAPLNLLTNDLRDRLAKQIRLFAQIYGDRMYEVYGSHDKVFELMIKGFD